jgi:hypothetical protein
MTRPGGTVFATGGLAAFMTWKQAEMLVILLEGGPQDTVEIADLARFLHDRDVAESVRPLYWGVQPNSINSCLSALQRRGLVRRTDEGVWHLTPAGRAAAEASR